MRYVFPAYKAILFVFIIFLVPFSPLKTLAAGSDPGVVAASQLVKRLFPKQADHFIFRKLGTDSGKDVYRLQSAKNKIVISGNNANAMAVGLNYYLKYYCNVSISWYRADKAILPVALPVVKEQITRLARCNNRFFLNYCTFGYTMPWWQWADWQWFIDWMALNGVNMPLAITGQESIWYNVWKKFGLTDGQIRGYFTGPAFLPWHRMANIDHWDGPLPMSWLNGQLKLQQQIVKRERELGMKPILPAFAGHVPEAIKLKFPGSKITSLGEWGGFDKEYQSYFLDPFDPLFNKIQKEFLAEQTRLFGTDHIYGTDPFNEVTPPSWEPDYLASVSKTIYGSLKQTDVDAQWLQMTWIFYFMREKWTNPRIEAYLKAVPQDKMILLDYFCDNTEVWKVTDRFFGQPYIWCYLGNFGSNTMIVGDIDTVENRMENAFKNGGKNVWGIGSTLEGFGVNPVMYEYVLEKAWADGPVNTDKWIDNWAARRRGKKDAAGTAAWEILHHKILVKSGALGQGVLTNARPTLTGHGDWFTVPDIDYKNTDLLKAWQLLNKTTDTNLPDVYKYDVVNVGRQVLGNYFIIVRDKFTAAYNKHDMPALIANGRKLMGIIHDMDALLATNSSFLLGKWINDARAMGVTPQEKNYYERDARLILATWGQKGHDLVDYANRNLSGLMDDYYGRRWSMFINDVTAAVKAGKPYDEKAFKQKSLAFEWNWSKQLNKYTAVPVGNSMQVSRALYKKYAAEIINN